MRLAEKKTDGTAPCSYGGLKGIQCVTVGVGMKRCAMFMLVLLIAMSLSPIASAATTETQFSDGTTTFSHSFTAGNGGDAQTPGVTLPYGCLLYTSPSPRDRQKSRMPSSA